MSIFTQILIKNIVKKIAVAVLCFISLSITSQEVTLRLNYDKGDVYLVKMKMDQTLGEAGGMAMDIEMNSSVIESSKDQYTLESKVESIKMDLIQGELILGYDSKAKDEDLDTMGLEMKKQMQPMMDAVITQVSNRYGKVLSTKVEPQVPGMDNFGQQAEYPEDAVKLGSTWSVESNDATTGNITITYKVDEISDTTVYVTLSGKLSAMQDSNVSGNMEIDIETGNPNVLNMEITAKADGSNISVKTTLITTKL